MEDLSRLCFFCMDKKDDSGVCPRCGRQRALMQDTPFLPLGSIIAERYYIGAKKRRNSEGCTYVAFDMKENRKCSIREFYPEALAVRDADGIGVRATAGSENAFADCIGSFRTLWETLARLRGLSALISVYDTFNDNGTAYAVYAEAEIFTLRDFLLQQNGGYIPWEEARILFMPVLSTLGTLHTSGIIHKGIDPNAFLMTEEGKLKLSGFSITQAKVCYGDLEPDVSDGYAPLEVYTKMGDPGAWTDVYSFTAVIYRALIGTTPIASPVRAENDQMMFPAKFAEKLPPYVINAIINGMQIMPDDRTRNTEQLRSNLSASPRAVGASAGIYRMTGAPEPEPPRANPVYNPGRDVAYTKEARPAPAPVREEPPAEENFYEPFEPETYQEPYRDGYREDYPAPAPAPEARRRVQTHRLQEELGPSAEELLEEQQQQARTRKILLAVLAFLVVLALTGLGLMISAKNGKKQEEATTTEIESYMVPNFVGMNYADVMGDTFLPTFFHFVRVEEYSASAPQGQILEQSVPVQTVAARGTEVILHVSAGPQSLSVPDVNGMTYEQASALLSPMGLVSVKEQKYNDGTHTPGTVAETVPPVGSPVTQGDNVTVVVWADLSETTTAAPATQPFFTIPTQTAPAITQPTAQQPTQAAPAPTEPASAETPAADEPTGQVNVDQLIDDMF